MSYEFLEHTADVKFRAEGATIEDMFSSTVDALNDTIRGDIKILEQEEKSFEIVGKDNEALLYNFLEEFLVLLDSEDFLIARIKTIDIKDGKLNCVVVGDKAENYKFTNDVKAVTYNEMSVKHISQDGRGLERSGEDAVPAVASGKWVCEVVLDV